MGTGAAASKLTMTLPGHQSDTSFRVRPADDFPSVFNWIPAARSDSLNLYPRICFEQLRVDHRVLGRRIVYLADLQAINFILGKGAANFSLSNLQKRLLKPALGDGLILAEGDAWITQRRLCLKFLERANAAFVSTDRRIERRLDALADDLRALPNLRDEQPSDEALILLQGAALDILFFILFDGQHNISTQRVITSIAEYRRHVEAFDIGDVLGLGMNWVSSKMRAARKAATAQDDLIWQILDEVSDPLLEDTDLPKHLQRDFVVSFLSGFETTALTTLWGLGVSAMLPDWQAVIRGSAVNTWPRTTKVVDDQTRGIDLFTAEILRLYPPLPFICRVADRTVDTNAGRIQKGDIVMMSPFVVQRHDQHWSRPNAFDPSRFNTGEPDAFIPFGTGARRCVGMHLGRFLIQFMLQQILMRVDVSLRAELPLPRGGMSLRPNRAMPLIFQSK